MLKVAPCTAIQSYILFFFWLDGLLLFCIIMGLRFASSAIIMYEESGVWVAVVEGGGRGGEWSQHFHQSFMIIC